MLDANYSGWDGSSSTGEALGNWRQAAAVTGLDARTKEIAPGKVVVWKPTTAGEKPVVTSASHGTFDNNIEVVGRTLERITGQQLVMPVDDLRGF